MYINNIEAKIWQAKLVLFSMIIINNAIIISGGIKMSRNSNSNCNSNNRANSRSNSSSSNNRANNRSNSKSNSRSNNQSK